MKISIITISFNQIHFLKKCIESVVEQGCSDLEYIVVDAGSVDGSRELINSYGDKVSVRIFERDNGAADGLNKGFSKATGDILGFLNSDDELTPGALEYVEKFFVENPDVDVLNGSGIKVDANGDFIETIYASIFSVDRYAFGAVNLLQQGCFFRRSVFDLVGGFNVDNYTCWDGELFLDMALAGARFMSSSKILGVFRIHEDSISGSGRLEEKYKNDCLRLFIKAKGRHPIITDYFVSFFWRLEKYISVFWCRFMDATK